MYGEGYDWTPLYIKIAAQLCSCRKCLSLREERFRERAVNHPQHLLPFDQRPLTDIFTVQPGQIEKEHASTNL
jgi:hypothetical protein